MFRLGIGTLLVFALLAGASDAQAQSCPLCVDFVTTYDADRGGPLPAKTRLQPQLVANVPYVVDVDGGLPPLPLGVLPIVPGYELRVTVAATDAAKPTVTVQRLITVTPDLPVRIEVVRKDADGVWKSFGYDGLASSAPQSFRAAIDLSKADHTHVDMTIGGAAGELTLVNEQFKGDPVGTRTARHIRRARFSGDGRRTKVPGVLSLDLDTAGATHAIVTRDVATIVDVLLDEPGRVTTGTLNEMPARIDLTVGSPDLNADQQPDTKVDWSAAARVATAVLRTTAGKQTTTATVGQLPSDAHLTLASPKADAVAPKQTTITYRANSRADHLNLVADEGGTHVLEADVALLPRVITKLAAIDLAGGGKQIVYDSDAQATSLDVDDTTRANGTLKQTKAHVDSLPSDVTLTRTAGAGEDHLHYDAEGNARKAHIETFEQPGDRRLTVDLDSTGGPLLPDDVRVDSVKGPGELHYDYTASGPIASAVVNGTNLNGLPDRVHNLNIALGGLPTAVGLDTVTHAHSDPPKREVYCGGKGPRCEPDNWPEDCDFTKPDVPHVCDIIPTKVTERSTTDSDIEVSAPQGRIGTAAVQLTDHAAVDPERLPATAHGKPQDGVLIRDLETAERYLVDVRMTGLGSALVHQHGYRMRVYEHNSGRPLGGDSGTEMKLRLDAVAPGHVLGFDQRKLPAGKTTTAITTAFLAGVPGLVELRSAANSSSPKFTTVDWSAPATIPAFCESTGGQQCAIDENPVSAFQYRELTQEGSGPLTPVKRLELDQLPGTLRICQAESGPSCSEGIFDTNIRRLAIGGLSDTHDCFPADCDDDPMDISPSEANAGSVMLRGSAPMRFTYETDKATINLHDMQRFALQGNVHTYGCYEFFDCKIVYVGMDSFGQDIHGEIVSGGAHFRFPRGWHADRHVWSAWKTGPASGQVASVGRIECPMGSTLLDKTLIDAGPQDITEQFCFGDVFGEGDPLDLDF